MCYREKEIEKLYWSIGEVAGMFQVKTSLVRFWIAEFDLNIRRNRINERFFVKEDIATITEIHRLLKQEGYTIRGAKRKLQQPQELILS